MSIRASGGYYSKRPAYRGTGGANGTRWRRGRRSRRRERTWCNWARNTWATSALFARPISRSTEWGSHFCPLDWQENSDVPCMRRVHIYIHACTHARTHWCMHAYIHTCTHEDSSRQTLQTDTRQQLHCTLLVMPINVGCQVAYSFFWYCSQVIKTPTCFPRPPRLQKWRERLHKNGNKHPRCRTSSTISTTSCARHQKAVSALWGHSVQATYWRCPPLVLHVVLSDTTSARRRKLSILYWTPSHLETRRGFWNKSLISIETREGSKRLRKAPWCIA